MARLFGHSRKPTLALRQRKAWLLQQVAIPADLLRASVVERFATCGKAQERSNFRHLRQLQPKSRIASGQTARKAPIAGGPLRGVIPVIQENVSRKTYLPPGYVSYEDDGKGRIPASPETSVALSVRVLMKKEVLFIFQTGA